VEYRINQAQRVFSPVGRMWIPVDNKKYGTNFMQYGLVFHITGLIIIIDLFI
jgi:hypothetical protein